MVKLGFIIALYGGLMACSSWTCDRFALPKILLMALGTMLLWGGLFAQALKGSVRPRPIWLDFIFVVMSAMLIFSSIFSIDLPLSILGPYLIPTFGVLQILLLMVYAYGLAWGAHEMPDKSLMPILVGASVILAGFAVAEGLGLLHVTFGQFYTPKDVLRASSLVGNPIFLSTTLAALLPASLHQIKYPGWRFILSFCAITLSLVALYFTHSRGGVLAFGCAGAVYFGLRYGMDWKKWAAAGAVAILLSSVLAFCYRKPGSDSIRTQTWAIALQSWQQSPLYGSGPNTFGLKFRQNKTDQIVKDMESSRRVHSFAHNDFLHIGATMGSIGVGVYFCILLLVFLMVKNTLTENRGTGAVVGASLAVVFLVVKFNPISLPELLIVFSMLGVAARQAGTLWPQTQRRASSFAGAAFLVSGLLFCLAAQRVIADHHYLRGIQLTNSGDVMAGSREFGEAAKLMPWEQKYTRAHIVSLFKLPAHAKNRDEALSIMETMLIDSQKMAARHPNNAAAHHTYARAMAMTYLYLQNDALGFAQVSIERAYALAPKFKPIIEFRKELRGLNGA